MSITPILSGKISGNNNSISFRAKKEQTDITPCEYPKNSSNLKRVPVMVLIAMSPLTTANTDAKTPLNPEIKTEMVAQNNNRTSRTSVRKKVSIDNGYEHMQFVHITNDSNANNDEMFGINYYYDSEGGYRGEMDLMVKTISSQPDANGRYTILCDELVADNNYSKNKIISVKAPFGKYILRFAKSTANNSAVTIDRSNSLQQRMNNNVPWIEDAVTRIYDPHTNKIFIIRQAR